MSGSGQSLFLLDTLDTNVVLYLLGGRLNTTKSIPEALKKQLGIENKELRMKE